MIWLRKDEWELAGGPEAVSDLVRAGQEALAEAEAGGGPADRAHVAARLARLRYHAARLAAEQFRLTAAIRRLLTRGGIAPDDGQASRDATPSPAAERNFTVGVFCEVAAGRSPGAAGDGSGAGGLDADDEEERQRALREAFGAGLWATARGPGREVPLMRMSSEAASLNYDVYVLANDNRALRFKLAGWRARLALAARGRQPAASDAQERASEGRGETS